MRLKPADLPEISRPRLGYTPADIPEYPCWYLDRLEQQDKQEKRHAQAASMQVVDYRHAENLKTIKSEVESTLCSYALRRQAEDELADYIADVAKHPRNDRRDLYSIVDSLRSCRRRAAVGIKEDGGRIFAWDNKCSIVRLCPDEARGETQRLAERYVPAMIDWVSQKPTRRIFYAVLTDHNFRPGQLLTGKRFMFDRLKDFLKHAYVRERVMGALAVEEDPLSATGDWNVHVNVLLCVEGEFSYQRIREIWGANVHLDKLPRDVAALTRATLELVKYSARHTGMKSAEKAASGESEAPAMTEWEPELWLEWWHAQRPETDSGRYTAFRRTRSYGCLYDVKYEPPVIDMDAVRWVGTAEYEGGWYRVFIKDAVPDKAVDLILEDKFFLKSKNAGSGEHSGRYLSRAGPPH